GEIGAQRPPEPAWHRRARAARSQARALLRVRAARAVLQQHHSCNSMPSDPGPPWRSAGPDTRRCGACNHELAVVAFVCALFSSPAAQPRPFQRKIQTQTVRWASGSIDTSSYYGNWLTGFFGTASYSSESVFVSSVHCARTDPCFPRRRPPTFMLGRPTERDQGAGSLQVPDQIDFVPKGPLDQQEGSCSLSRDAPPHRDRVQCLCVHAHPRLRAV
ncbi:unnamed protein product, partial [Prorocentrum cordatum]